MLARNKNSSARGVQSGGAGLSVSINCYAAKNGPQMIPTKNKNGLDSVQRIIVSILSLLKKKWLR